MKLILMLSLLFTSVSFSQNQHMVGDQQSSDVFLRVKSFKASQEFLIKQVYEYLSKSPNVKNLFKSDISLKKDDFPVVLVMEKLNEKSATLLQDMLLVDFGNQESLSQDVREDFLNGKYDYSQDESFLNRATMHLSFQGLSYDIDPKGVSIDNYEVTSPDSDRLRINIGFNFSKITAKAEKICLRLGTFIRNDKGNIVEDLPNTICDEEINIEKFFDDYKNGNLKTSFIKTKKADYLKNIKLTASDINVEINDEAPLKLNLGVEIFNTSLHGLSLKVLDGDISSFIPSFNDGFENNFNLEIGEVAVDGLAGFSVQGQSLLFSDKELKEALGKRKDFLIKLLLKPVEKNIQKLLKETNLTSESFFLAGDLKFGEDLPVSNYSFDHLFFDNRNPDVNQIGFGFSFNLGLNTHRKGSVRNEDIQESLAQYLNEENNKKGDIVLSITEDFVNNLIEHYSSEFSKSLKTQPISMKSLEFNINGDQSGDELIDSSLLGCISFEPKKWSQRMMERIVGGKAGINFPLQTYGKFKVENNRGEAPSFTFNLTEVETSGEFISENPDCPLAKRFKKMASKIIGKEIDKRYNSLSKLPLVKIEFEGLENLSEKILQIELDETLKTMNFIIELEDVSSIKKEITDKIVGAPDRIKITFPKIEYLKKNFSKNK